MTSSRNEGAERSGEHSQESNREEIPPEYLGSVLRAEIMPASEVSPDQPAIGTFIKQLNMRLVSVVVLFLILFGSGLVCFIGPGKPMLENSLLSLKKRYELTTPTFTSTLSSISTGTALIQSSSTPSSTPRFTPIPASKTPTDTPEATATEEDLCINAVDVTLEDVGTTMCIRGIITGMEEREVGFIIYFSDQRGVFYLVTYDLVWDDAEPGDCIQITGEIQQLANTPVLVFGWNNLPEFCP